MSLSIIFFCFCPYLWATIIIDENFCATGNCATPIKLFYFFVVVVHLISYSSRHSKCFFIEWLFLFLGDAEGDRKSNAWFGVSVYSAGHNEDVLVGKPDYYTFLGNCPPTPPLSQHFA